MHSVYSGGLGIDASPPWAWPAAAFFSQRSNSSLVMVESPTLATALAGRLFPQPATAAAQTPARATAASERTGVKREVIWKKEFRSRE